MRHIRKRLTYANVMSSIAVFLVLGGATAFALSLPKNSVGTKQLKNNAVTGPKVKNGSLEAVDFKAGQLPAGPKGERGEPGAPGEPGTAFAFAYVNAGNEVTSANSKNVTNANLTHPGTGTYCFSGLNPAPKVAVATPQYWLPKPRTVSLFMGAYGPPGAECPAGTQTSVVISEEGNVQSDSPFTIIFDK